MNVPTDMLTEEWAWLWQSDGHRLHSTGEPRVFSEVFRVLKPGGSAVIIDLSRPANPLLRFLHRIGTALVLPLVGLIFARAPGEYWYLHKTLDSLPQPEILFTGRSLDVEEIWRSGLFGFVYGVRLRKRAAAAEKEPEAA